MMLPTRRTVLAVFLSAPALPLGTTANSEAQTPQRDLTPACADQGELTAASVEGPFFKPEAPMRHDLSADAPNGEKITIIGFVLDVHCRPVSQALVQLWHADEAGRYDNTGYRLRGHHYTDDSGRWWFTTIVPALYPGRTRHYHLKIQRPAGAVLTTQLYFPGEPRNARDPLFDKRLLLQVTDAADGKFGRFDFIV
jgi:protocatechuate 3,4-dioxygenase beta subunit